MRAFGIGGAIGAALVWSASASAQTPPGEIENPFVRAAYCTAAADQASNFDTYGDWTQVVFTLYGSAYARGHEDLYVTPPTVEPSVLAEHDAACTALLPGLKAEAGALAEAAGPRVEASVEASVESGAEPTDPAATPEARATADATPRAATAAPEADPAHCYALASMLSQGLQAEPDLYGFERDSDVLAARIAEVGTLFQNAEAAAASSFDSIDEMQMASQDAWIAIDAAAGAAAGADGRRDVLFALYDDCRVMFGAAP